MDGGRSGVTGLSSGGWRALRCWWGGDGNVDCEAVQASVLETGLIDGRGEVGGEAVRRCGRDRGAGSLKRDDEDRNTERTRKEQRRVVPGGVDGGDFWEAVSRTFVALLVVGELNFGIF